MGKVNEKYFYKIYGLNVMSQIPLIEAEACSFDKLDFIDVEIIISNIPDYIKRNFIYKDLKRCYKKEIYFSINTVAHYYILEGRHIFIEPMNGASWKNIRSFLLGYAFGRLFKQLDIVAIHGGAVSINNRGIILSGESNSGKTALTTGFINNNYGFLSDDVVVIDFNRNNEPILIPSYPYQKLRKDTAEYMNINDGSLNNNRLGRELNDSFIYTPVKLNSLFEIVPDSSVREVKVKKVHQLNKMEVLYKSIYMKIVITIIILALIAGFCSINN